MPCEAPIRGYRPANGGPVRFTLPNPDRDTQTYAALDIPCGVCFLCRKEHNRQQAIRIYHEAMMHDYSSFVTLSYNNESLPRWGSLNYEHLTLFWKQLRKKYGRIRYYACGEYGDTTDRAHYHAIIFGQAFLEDRRILRTKPTLLWTSPTLEKIWARGMVSVGAVTFESARYTASYITKQNRKGKTYTRVDDTTGELIPLVQPKSFMSDNLGRTWWEKFGHQLQDHDRVVINGQPQKPPKAYDRWLRESNEQRYNEIKEERKANAKVQTPDQMRARARNAHAHAGLRAEKKL